MKPNNISKNKQSDLIALDLTDIFNKYQCIYFKILNKPQSNNYTFEMNLLKDVEMIIDIIRFSILPYNNSDFTYETTINANNTLIKKIVKNLLTIKEFCSCLIEYGETSKDNKILLKDIIAKRAENDLYNYLLGTIESLYPTKDLNRVDAQILSSSINVLEYKSNEIINAINELENSKIKSIINLKTRTDILKIRNKHFNDYFKECYILESGLSKVIKSIGNDKYKKEWYEKNTIIIKNIHDAIRNDDFKKAESLIKEIENMLTTQ